MIYGDQIGETKKSKEKKIHICIYIYVYINNVYILSSKNQALDIKILHLMCVKIEKH